MDTKALDLEQPNSFTPAGKVNFNPTALKGDFATLEAFKTLRTNLLFCSEGIKTIVVTSTFENEGKSTISVGLARSLSEIGKKTLFIDADMRKSVFLKNSHKTQNIKGLSELLSNQATIQEVLYNTQLPDFDVIFSGNFPPNPVELLSSTRLPELLEQFKAIYDFVIIDTPPLNPIIDAAVISAHSDGAILVVGLGKSKIKETSAVKEQLLKSGCKILGAVINEPDSKYPRYAYKKYYSYYGVSKKKTKLKKAK